MQKKESEDQEDQELKATEQANLARQTAPSHTSIPEYSSFCEQMLHWK